MEVYGFKKCLALVLLYLVVFLMIYMLSSGFPAMLETDQIRLMLLQKRMNSGIQQWSLMIPGCVIFAAMLRLHDIVVNKKITLYQLYRHFIWTIFDYAVVYFFFIMVYEKYIPIKGICQLDMTGSATSIMLESLRNFVDCFHFSVTNATTLGYGDITPNTWYTKLLVDTQVLVSLFMFSIGINKVIQNRSAKKIKNSGSSQ